MESDDVEQQYRGDKPVKRGMVYERKGSHPTTSRIWHTLDPAPLDEYCTPRRYILATGISCLLAIFALAGCILFSNFIGGNYLSHEGLFVSYNSYGKTNCLPLQTLGETDVNSEAEYSPSEAIAIEPALAIRSRLLGCNEKGAILQVYRYTRAEMRAIGGDGNRELQEKLVAFLKQPAWQASGGCDHVLVIHHPNSMHVVRDQLGSVVFVVADFGRYSLEYANIGKDIVAPYKHIISALPQDMTSIKSRKTLLFFQGAIHRKDGGIIRQQLYELLKDVADIHFEAGNTTTAAIRSSTEGMQSSKFCLNLAGDTPSSNRLFDAIASHRIPVIISDEIELPFEDDLDYSKFYLFVKSDDALKSGFVINLLRGVSSEEWIQMWRRLREVDHHFKYQHPTKPDDAVHMTWKAIARKVSKVRLLNKKTEI